MTAVTKLHRSRTVALTLVLAWLLLVPGLALAQSGPPASPADPATLVEDAPSLDGEEILLVGEAIGDRLHSGDDHVWINVLGDEDVAVGVWIPRSETEDVTFYGDYLHAGDRVQVVGVLNAACDAHGGDLDVHSMTFEIVEAGHAVDRPAEPVWAILGAVAIGVAVVLQRIGRTARLRAPGVHR